MRKTLGQLQGVLQRLEGVELKQLQTDSKLEKVLKALEKDLPPKQGIFFEGQLFDAHVFASNLIKQAKKSLVLVDNYVDVGTAEDWIEYNDKAVVFCDIDGTIVKAQHRKDFGQPPEPLERTIRRVQELAANGGKIVFTTARPDSTYDLIHDMLEKLGFTDFKLITGLPNVKRILINDYNSANPYPRAIAVNVRRDADDLPDLI
jgi:hypothetical protein